MSSLRQAISERVLQIHSAALDLVVADTQAAAPVRTGRLQASIQAAPSALIGDFVGFGSVFSPVAYAEYTDTGSQPHIIEGRPLLYFYWDKIGRFVALPFVNHPGSPGTHWFAEPMAARWSAALEAAAA